MTAEIFPWIRKTREGIALTLKISPRSKKNSFSEISEEQLKISVAAPPLEGKANKALIDFFCKTFSLPKKACEILQGSQSRNKVVLLRGIGEEEFLEILEEKKSNSARKRKT